ncbi:hypothetical protein B0H14DRAFT_3860841 [Mycena olivaceomarginata]|nr:hypothetical protein B0H14DRAFT_3860841 [Mycena olivaceomarginata]
MRPEPRSKLEPSGGYSTTFKHRRKPSSSVFSNTHRTRPAAQPPVCIRFGVQNWRNAPLPRSAVSKLFFPASPHGIEILRYVSPQGSARGSPSTSYVSPCTATPPRRAAPLHHYISPRYGMNFGVYILVDARMLDRPASAASFPDDSQSMPRLRLKVRRLQSRNSTPPAHVQKPLPVLPSTDTAYAHSRRRSNPPRPHRPHVVLSAQHQRIAPPKRRSPTPPEGLSVDRTRQPRARSRAFLSPTDLVQARASALRCARHSLDRTADSDAARDTKEDENDNEGSVAGERGGGV